MILLLGAQWPTSILPTTRMYPAEWYSQTKLNYASILWYINSVEREKFNTLCVVDQLKLEPLKHRHSLIIRLTWQFFQIALGTN